MAEPKLKVVVVTSSFPFGTDEEFPAAEAACWPVGELDFTVVPISIPGEPHALTPDIRIDVRLARYRTRWRKYVAVAVACLHPLLLREAIDLVRARSLTPARLAASVLVIGQTLLIRRGLRMVLSGLGNDVVVYSYWHSAATYAAVLLKRAGQVELVVSRAHGSDVYEAIAPSRWHPLKRQMIADVDHTWTVSDDAASELVNRYKGVARRISVSRLGVRVPEVIGPGPEPGVFRVLSMSTCTPLKQVPLIARAVGRFAGLHPQVQVHWTHLGDGPGLSELRSLFNELRASCANLSGWLPGFLDHEALLELLRDQPFDVLVNASTSEGVPVSIMEAMSYGVPAIAPNVGGVAELVGPETGWLLSAVVSESELAAALARAVTDRGSMGRRAAARRRVEHRFDSDANYREFAQELVSRLRQSPAGQAV